MNPALGKSFPFIRKRIDSVLDPDAGFIKTSRRLERSKPVVKRGLASKNHRIHEARRSPNQERALEGREKRAGPHNISQGV